MPPIDRLVAFALTAAVVIVVPGPSVLLIVGRALSAGRRTALLSVAGGTVVFLAAILPQFVARSHSPVTVQILVLGRVFSAIALVCDSAWTLGAHRVRSWLATSPRRLTLMQGVGGVAIAAVGVAVLATGRRT